MYISDKDWGGCEGCIAPSIEQISLQFNSLFVCRLASFPYRQAKAEGTINAWKETSHDLSHWNRKQQ